MTIFVDHYSDWLKVPKKWEGGGHLFGTDLTVVEPGVIPESVIRHDPN